jgi:hypothetical protein
MVAGLLAACGGGSTDGSGSAAGEGNAPANSSGGAEKSGGTFFLGEPLDDVERYFGLYGEQGIRQFLVIEAKRPKYAEKAPEVPPGYVAIAAMWADVSPMYMKSLSESKFEQVDLSDFAPEVLNVAEFEFGPDGKPVALAFTQGDLSQYGRRERIGDVPAEWQ